MCRARSPLLALLFFGCLAPSGHSQQFSSNPYVTYQPTYISRYWGYTYDPYGSYLSGAAQVIDSQGKFMVSRQQAAILREQARSAKIDNRRKEIEQWLWERENLPTTEDERERYMKAQLRRSRNDPPLTEIWSAKALNDLLIDLQKAKPSEGSAPELKSDLLVKINVTTGKREANIGFLKAGKFNWPLMLRREAFAQDRDEFEKLFNRATQQAAKDQMDADALEGIIKRITQLEKKLTTILRTSGDEDFTPTMYIDAKNFLHQLNDGVKVLQQPDAGNYLTGKYSARGRNVAELIRHMTENGLRFAAASPGNESAYTALHRAMAQYDVREGSQLK